MEGTMNNKEKHSWNYVPLAERFWQHVDKQGPLPSAVAAREHPEIAGTQCWMWTAYINAKGYGCVGTKNGKVDLAHRVAWFLATGTWPKPFGLHKCDNPACIRKLHLFEGTHQINTEDKEAKGRGNQAKGERSGNAKLTQVEVNRIRLALINYKRGMVSALATKHSVSYQLISRIKNNGCWKA